jgi:hypothetical protein
MSQSQSNPYAPPSVDEAQAVSIEAFSYESAGPLAMALRCLLGAWVPVSVVSLVIMSGQLDLLERMASGGAWTMDEATSNDEQVATLAVVNLLLLLVTGIVWFVWQARTSKNVRALGAEFMEFGPHAWGWFFCPILNLWRPLQVLRELWRVANPNAKSASGWAAEPAPPVFSIWWGTWIIGGIAAQISFRMVRSDSDLDTLILSTQLDMFADAANIIAAIAAIFVVTQIHRRVEARAAAGH